MATYFLYKQTGNILSSQIGDIEIYSDENSVVVNLTAPGKVMVLKERFYPHSNKISLFDMGELIENDMRGSGYMFADYTISLQNGDGSVADSCTMHVGYCDRLMNGVDTEKFFRENFLSTLTIRRVAPNDTLSLFYFAMGGEGDSGTLYCQWTSSSVNVGVKSYNFNVNGHFPSKPGIQQINVSQCQLKENLHNMYGIGIGAIEIVSFTVNVGERSMTCFVDDSLDMDDDFFFRNCFNVWDVAAIPHFTFCKTEVERSLAIVNSQSQFYNQQSKKCYEVQSGGLTSDEAQWIDQLFTSHEVLRFVPNDDVDKQRSLQKILITDSMCEISDGDEKPNTVKFSWQYSDSRILSNGIKHFGIFNESFNLIFD